ncbi:MAG: hypothetical protein AAGA70_13780 [Pseudomonadota bacterium]
MKTLILSSAIALGLAAPSFANDQLAAGLGVEPGVYSTAELVRLNTALEDDDRAFYRHATTTGTGSGSAAAAEIFSILAAEDDEGVTGRDFNRVGGSEVISTQSFGASDAARAFAIEQALQDDNRSLARYLQNGGALGSTQNLF